MNAALSAVLWVLLTGAGLSVSALPRGLELRLGRALGRLALRLDPKRRRIAFDNIRRCLPELGPRGWEKLLRENYEHYGILALELLHMFSPIPGHWRGYALAHTSVEQFDNWRKAHEKHGSSICITAHLANWELMGAAGITGVPMLMATRPLKPQWLHERVVAARKELKVEAAFGRRIVPMLIKHLKAGKSIGFVLDQYAAPPMGVEASFFGVKPHTQAAVGLLASRTGAAVVPVLQRRDARGVVHIVFEPAIELSPEILDDPVRSTEIFVARVEAWIRATPAQWLWAHRRFKNVSWPDEMPAAAR